MAGMKLVALAVLGLAFESRAADSGGKVESPPQPVPPLEAPGRMKLPPGFKVTLFASEPDVRQPIAFTMDDRARLWVAECYSYPNWKTEGNDRILIFEDVDGDGHFDRRKVFWDKGANVTGLEVGFGGAWVCSTPNLIFLADKDGDDVPDGSPEVLLDGWSLECKHNAFNALTWGPDGWLYGCNGILATSRVGRPGTPDHARVPINCGVWRYHPTKQLFEVVAWGTTNPWGLDFDDHGQAFITNCVIPHLYHVVPGAHFQRMYGQDFDPHLYGLIESCADHIHWAGGAWQESRGGKGKHGEAGGGHAHAGAMIYLGDSWPDAYRGTIFTCNIHGNRVNHDSLRRSGSGYVGSHEQDFLLANDEWFRGLELKYGPDGSVFLTDWSDIGECHDTDSHGAHHESGRIYRISYGDVGQIAVNLRELSDAKLVELQLQKNDWFVRHARRILAERAADKKDMTQVHGALEEMLSAQKDVTRRLRALWALHVTGGLSEPFLMKELGHSSEYIRSWAVRLLCEEKNPPRAAIEKFAAMARTDRSPFVRLHLASALQRMPPAERWPIADALVEHGEDALDRYLPLMIWYGIEPLVAADGGRAVEIAARSQIPLLRQFIARRATLASSLLVDAKPGRAPQALESLVELLAKEASPSFQLDLLAGIHQALRGRKRMKLPLGWEAAYARLSGSPDANVREQATLLSVLFGDPQAASALEKVLMDTRRPGDERQRALQALVEKGVPGLPLKLQKLIDEPEMRGAALRALAAYDDDATPEAILARYHDLSSSEQSDALSTLSSRPTFALRLLAAVEKGTVPRCDLSAFTVRQLQAFFNPDIDAKLEKVWGTVRPASKEKAESMAKYKAMLGPEQLKGADLSRGRLVCQRTCLQCHRLFGEGGDVGPDLTGSQRSNLDYLLENVLDPSRVIGKDYQLTTLFTRDGRLVSGIIRERSETALVMQTANERVVLALEDILDMSPSDVSMMPENIFDALRQDEIRDLVAYLASEPPPGEKPLKALPAPK